MWTVEWFPQTYILHRTGQLVRGSGMGKNPIGFGFFEYRSL